MSPIDLLARNRDLRFHLDIGLAMQSRTDPVAFINSIPAAFKPCRAWPNDSTGRPPLMGQGTASWRRIFAAAETAGGVEFYLVQQEGSADPPITAVEKDLTNFRELHGRL